MGQARISLEDNQGAEDVEKIITEREPFSIFPIEIMRDSLVLPLAEIEQDPSCLW
jgi:hypothetical protein